MTQQSGRDFGPYHLDKMLSDEGGQGVVWLATQKTLQTQVVIKILRDHLAKSDSFVSRFTAEAVQLARMDHANIVRVRQTDKLGSEYFIEMEYIEGWDLLSWLTEHGRLPPEVVVVLLQRIAAGLQHAHERGIIHRDVKLANVMLTGLGEVKVLDFGLARDLDASGRSAPGALMGTYAYMSPQQVRGEEATHWFDVYSLGVVGYHLLAGDLPFKGTIASVCMKIENEDPPPLEKYRGDIPKPLVKLIKRMMEKDPRQRPPDMRAVEVEVGAIATRMGIRTSDDLLVRYVADPDATGQVLNRRRTQRRQRPYALGVAGAMVLLVVGMLIYNRIHERGPSDDPSTAVDRPRSASALDPESTPSSSSEVTASSLPVQPQATSPAAPATQPQRGPATPAGTPSMPAQGASSHGSTPSTAQPGAVNPSVPHPVPAVAGGVPPATGVLVADSVDILVTVSPAGDINLEGTLVARAVPRWSGRVVRHAWHVNVDCGDYGKQEQHHAPRPQDAVLKFDFDLASGNGGVFVTGPRGGLDIYVDGTYQKVSTPAPVRPLSVGPHRIEVRDRNTHAVVASQLLVVVQGGSNQRVEFKPQP